MSGSLSASGIAIGLNGLTFTVARLLSLMMLCSITHAYTILVTVSGCCGKVPKRHLNLLLRTPKAFSTVTLTLLSFLLNSTLSGVSPVFEYGFIMEVLIAKASSHKK